jgi:hypothetical protein
MMLKQRRKKNYNVYQFAFIEEERKIINRAGDEYFFFLMPKKIYTDDIIRRRIKIEEVEFFEVRQH